MSHPNGPHDVEFLIQHPCAPPNIQRTPSLILRGERIRPFTCRPSAMGLMFFVIDVTPWPIGTCTVASAVAMMGTASGTQELECVDGCVSRMLPMDVQEVFV